MAFVRVSAQPAERAIKSDDEAMLRFWMARCAGFVSFDVGSICLFAN